MLANQKGMALITVLLVTALVAMLAVSMSFAQHVAVRRTANLLEGDQAMVLALGLEEWGRWVLNRDSKGSDNLGENWAMGLPPTAVENGVVSGSFVDMQGRINLNNLVLGSSNEIAQAEQMLEQLYEDCEADNGAFLVRAVADWLDDDSNPRPGGAEDNEYLLHEPAYLAANRPMTSPSELLLIEGFTPEIYLCVKEHVAALPGPTKINLNTAGPVVISTLSPGLSVAAAEEIVMARPDDGYASIADFLADPALAGTGINPDGLSLTSGYFMARARAVFGEAEVELYTLFSRTTLVEVVARSIGTY
ncbi:MAG: type II secretion system minor pseudopilin GspK [Desulfurivibrionaceae bacterium]|nr:type II secretion system minor pseudopilin GspK [Desulfobulbales bacterium]MDT8334073.1 type II secretion system minor pseudopilin GspK [Desulfurivibrionaceae bacterium]